MTAMFYQEQFLQTENHEQSEGVEFFSLVACFSTEEAFVQKGAVVQS